MKTSLLLTILAVTFCGVLYAQEEPAKKSSSFLPVILSEEYVKNVKPSGVITSSHLTLKFIELTEDFAVFQREGETTRLYIPISAILYFEARIPVF